MAAYQTILVSKLRIYDFIRCYNTGTGTRPLCFITSKHVLRPGVVILMKHNSQRQTISQGNWSNNEKPWSLSRKHLQYSTRLFQTAVSCFSADTGSPTLKRSEITEADYETYSEQTLDSLTEYFEDLPENESCNKDYDCAYGNGVITVHIGGVNGTYVINKQSPNKQIWLSSPVSGPKRYDYFDGQWVYLRDGTGLHKLLEQEICELTGLRIELKKCKYYSWGIPNKT